MSSIEYIGRAGRFVGKSLPQICLKLKDFGIGRMFIRETYKRYPGDFKYGQHLKVKLKTELNCVIKIETTYYILTKMEADMSDEYMRMGEFNAEVVFRGAHYGNMSIPGHKEDFQLVPKHMEEFYKSKTLPKGQKWREPTVVPKFVDLPPLLKEMLVQEAALKKINLNAEELKLPFIVKEDTFSHIKYQ